MNRGEKSNVKKCTDEQLKESYSSTGSIYRTADEFGMCPQSVHERLQRLGVQMMNHWTADDDERLRQEYIIYRSQGKLQQLADSMGRTRFFIARKANALGLTDHKTARPYQATWKYMSEGTARMLFDSFKDSSLLLGQFCEKYGYNKNGFADTMRKFWPDEYEAVIEAKAPRGTMYRLGREVEYRVRDQLKAWGFIAMRSPASKTPVDIMAVRKDAVLLVQCKRSGQLPVSEWNEIFDLAESVGAIPVMAERPYPKEYRYWRLDARKDGSRKRQPMTRITITPTTITEYQEETS